MEESKEFMATGALPREGDEQIRALQLALPRLLPQPPGVGNGSGRKSRFTEDPEML